MADANKELREAEALVDRLRSGKPAAQAAQPKAAGTKPAAVKQAAPQSAARQLDERELKEFLQHFPGVVAKDIPRAVWLDVQRGVPLALAYAKAEIQRLSKDVEDHKNRQKTQEKNDRNREMTIGGMRSDGTSDRVDDFLRGFNNG